MTEARDPPTARAQGVVDALSPPPPLALVAGLAVTASVGIGAEREARSARGRAGGRRAQRARPRASHGAAIDSFEAALAVDPALRRI